MKTLIKGVCAVVVVLGVVGFAPELPAQNAGAPTPTVSIVEPGDFSAEPFVVQRYKRSYAMKADGTGVREQVMELKVQSEAALKEFGVVAVPFASASERVEFVYARVRQADGTVVETPTTDAQEQPEAVTREAPMYSDLKEVQLPIKGLRVGDTLEWRARVFRTSSEAAGNFWGQESFLSGVVVREEVVELRYPKTMKATVWTNPANPKGAVKSTETIAGDERVYRWTSQHLKPTTGPEAEAEKKKKEKTIWTAEEEVEAKEGAWPAVAWTTFPSWEAVGAWYRGVEGDRMVADAAVRAKAAELTAGKTSAEEKARALYEFVSTEVRYVGVSLGIGRYQPHTAGEVLANRYGDCKDKHTLLAAMLGTVGLPADGVMVGVGIRFNPAVPDPAAFNHLITRVKIGSREVWLDATPEVAPYEMLSYAVRDKDVVVVPQEGAPSVQRTPVTNPSYPSLTTMNVRGTLDQDGVEHSRVELTMRGDTELVYRVALHTVAVAQFEAVGQRLWGALGFAGTTSNVQIGRPEDTAVPLRISFDLKREQAGGRWGDNQIVAQLSQDGLPLVDAKEPPIRSIELGAPRTEVSHFEMRLPQGWGAGLPKEVHEKTEFANYELTYRFEYGTLYADKRLEIYKDRVRQSDWRSYLRWQEAVGLGEVPYVRMISGGKGVVVSEPEGRLDDGAAKLVADAGKALDTHDVETASPLLEKAREINAEQPGLWAAMGRMSELRGENKTAIHDYGMELVYHTKAYATYAAMARLEVKTGKRAEAMDTLRTWMSAAPGDPAPVAQMMLLVMDGGGTREALALGDEAVKSLPVDSLKTLPEPVGLSVARKQFRAGKEADGVSTLTAMLQIAANPVALSEGAGMLAAHRQGLDVAEASARKALALFTAESREWTLASPDKRLLLRSKQVVAAWATMGWVLLQEGKVAAAESYLEAAWRNVQSAETGEWLGDARAAAGDVNGARQVYEMVLSHGANAGLEAKLEKVKAAGAKAGAVSGYQAMEQIRMLPLGDAGGRYGVAEYRVLLERGAVMDAVAEGEKTVPRGVEMLKAANLEKLFPEGEQVRLVLEVMLNCSAESCELVLEP